MKKTTNQQTNQQTNRGKEFLVFANEVLQHIEDYTVPQYGDAPDDLVQEYSAEECVRAIEKYCRRFRKQARPNQDELDMKKIAHYACLAFNKL